MDFGPGTGGGCQNAGARPLTYYSMTRINDGWPDDHIIEDIRALSLGNHDERVEKLLIDLSCGQGPTSEILGRVGRFYKTCWAAAAENGPTPLSRSLLDKAVESYLCGLQADRFDAYLGINVVTLMELREPADPRREEILPLVALAFEEKMAKAEADYWDHATLLELAVLAKDKERAEQHARDALAAMRELWEAETTLRNLRLIREARAGRKENIAWLNDIEAMFGGVVEEKPTTAKKSVART